MRKLHLHPILLWQAYQLSAISWREIVGLNGGASVCVCVCVGTLNSAEVYFRGGKKSHGTIITLLISFQLKLAVYAAHKCTM